MIGIGRAHGKRVVALLTAMDRPLGYAVGNALEVAESIAALRGEGPPDLHELTVIQAAEMLVLGGVEPDPDRGRRLAEAALADGRAAACFARIIEAQGGNPAVLEDPGQLPRAPLERLLTAESDGWVGGMDVRAIGFAAVALGAGRRTLESRIDPAVGFHITAKPGAAIAKGEPLARVHARTEAAADQALAELRNAIPVVAEQPAPGLPLVLRRLTA